MSNSIKCILYFAIASLIACSVKEDLSSPNSETPSACHAIFGCIWKTFDEKYPNFESKGVDWYSMYRAINITITNETSEIELSKILKEVTLSLRDIHIPFEFSGDVTVYRKRQFYKP